MMNSKTITIIATAMMVAAGCARTDLTDAIGVDVTADENREYSYTDKKAGYWYGTTHQETTEWWSGWNMAKKRILADYALGTISDGKAERLNRRDVTGCIVYPDRLERTWKGTQETFRLLDNVPVVHIGL